MVHRRRRATDRFSADEIIVRTLSNIPVPSVLDWSDDDSALGTEYIIMEYAPGVQLHGQWPSMNSVQHMLCVQKASYLMAEMAKLKFPAYGSLYFADAPIAPDLKIQFTDGFCIGPHCGVRYRDTNPLEPRFYGERAPNRGPCKLLPAICAHAIYR
jgi:serine/threonine protein kinase